MNRDELFQGLEAWLKGEDIKYEADTRAGSVTFDLVGSQGEWSCQIICEDKPSLLQIMCRLPVRVPEDQLTRVSLILHRLNQRLRIGSFTLDPEERVVAFRLATPVREEAPLEAQVAGAVHAAINVFDAKFPLLCALLCDNEETRRRLAELTSHGPAIDTSCLPRRGSQPELN